MLFSTASDGINIITAMLLTGLAFLAVIGIGELLRWRRDRRFERQRRAGTT